MARSAHEVGEGSRFQAQRVRAEQPVLLQQPRLGPLEREEWLVPVQGRPWPPEVQRQPVRLVWL